MNIKLFNDWVLVDMEPIKQSRGSILLVHGERVRTGKVLAVGPGRYISKESGIRAPVGVATGERIAFFRENLEHKQGKTIMHLMEEVGENIGLIRAPDILFVVEEEGDVDITA